MPALCTFDGSVSSKKTLARAIHRKTARVKRMFTLNQRRNTSQTKQIE
jgi:hypothetical protein